MKEKNPTICYHPIGMIHSPFLDISGMPIQPAGAGGVRGWIEVKPEFAPGLKDLDGFSHIILLYHFDRVQESLLEVIPFLDSRPHGVFATRAPKRPNPIGLSVVRLVEVRGNILEIEQVDILDETPLLDIKPYAPAFDVHSADRSGWLEEVGEEVRAKRSDDRFG